MIPPVSNAPLPPNLQSPPMVALSSPSTGKGSPSQSATEYVATTDGTATVEDSGDKVEPFDPSMAQNLPDDGQVNVVGTLDSSQPPPTYLLPLDPGAETIVIDVHPTIPGQPMPDHMSVFDSFGHKLLESLTDSNSNTIHLELVTGEFEFQGGSPRALFLQFVLPTSSANPADLPVRPRRSSSARRRRPNPPPRRSF